MLDSVERAGADRLRAGDELEEVYTWFLEDDEDEMVRRLAPRGFERSDGPGGHVLLADLQNVAALATPTGYLLTHVSDPDVHRRVESHRAAFPPSDLTVPMYRRARRA